jgi:hypothetical protein
MQLFVPALRQMNRLVPGIVIDNENSLHTKNASGDAWSLRSRKRRGSKLRRMNTFKV